MNVLYAVLKFAVYSGWCWVGLKLFRPHGERRPRAALGLGLLRLGMGAFFGILIWVLGTAAARPLGGNQVLIYLAVYVPVRWIEWAIIDLLIQPERFSFKVFFLGAGPVSRGWRARGIVVSCLADVPVIVSMGGLPLGRFMC